MSHVVTIDLPAAVAERAQAVATHTHRPVEDVLLEWLGRAATDIPIEWLPDDEVLALGDLEMSQSAQADLSALLTAQSEGTLTQPERERLTLLLDQYRNGMLRKAQALKVAAERGLVNKDRIVNIAS